MCADLTVWRHAADRLELMSGRGEDVHELAALAGAQAAVSTSGDDDFLYALQGPRALQALRGLADLRALAALPWFGFSWQAVAGVRCLVGRLGWSGEPGFEIIGPGAQATRVWHSLAAVATPAGALAMDRLRVEAGLMLFTRECVLGATPAELGLARLVARPVPAATMRLAHFVADGALPTRHETPRRRPASSSRCGSTRPAGAGPRDLQGRLRHVRLLPGPALEDARERPRRPWPALA